MRSEVTCEPCLWEFIWWAELGLRETSHKKSAELGIALPLNYENIFPDCNCSTTAEISLG